MNHVRGPFIELRLLNPCLTQFRIACADGSNSFASSSGVRPARTYRTNCSSMCESFFATLECELIDLSTFRNHDEARDAIFELHRRVLQHASPALGAQLRFTRAVRESVRRLAPPDPTTNPSTEPGQAQ